MLYHTSIQSDANTCGFFLLVLKSSFLLVVLLLFFAFELVVLSGSFLFVGVIVMIDVLFCGCFVGRKPTKISYVGFVTYHTSYWRESTCRAQCWILTMAMKRRALARR